MRAQRPVYLNLLKIRQPLPAVVSILHRISGFLLFLLLPFALFAFQNSLSSEQAFLDLAGNAWLRAGMFVMLGMYVYHFFAGLRFLVFDLHRPALYPHIRSSAHAVLLLTLIALLLLKGWLW